MIFATEQKKSLPRLRKELVLRAGAPAVTGEQTWLIHDPLQHRYFQIDKSTYTLLSVWSDASTAEELLAKIEGLEQIAIDRDDIDKLTIFLSRNKLIELSEQGSWKAVLAEREFQKNSQSTLSWLAHNYLFFRLPIWQPQAFLEQTLPLIRLVISRQTVWLVVVLGLIGLYLVSREWNAFTSTFQYVFTWEGAIATALALASVKVMHEMGHAYTAVHYGCRVPTMGLAFMLMTPMLYTDVTDAWRLRERHKRLAIAGAGVLVELTISAICLFAWAFLPEGPLRGVAFMLATASIFASFAINLNPFMRFDGYYLLADWLGIENLQERSFNIARWRLREWLFGLDAPCPEQLPRQYINILTIYAVCVWIYRLLLFIGIALIVYHYFFKVLGIILFLFEIGFFVARPVWSEMKMWWSLRQEIRRSRRSVVAGLALVTTVFLIAMPWSTRVEIPAVLEPVAIAKVYPSRPARIVATHVVPGQKVDIGEPLFTLDVPDIAKELEITTTKLRLARMQHDRRMADQLDREASLVLESTIHSLTSKIAGLKREQAELVVRSPLKGRIAELAPNLHANRWLGARDLLALVIDDNGWIARGYVSENDLWRIESGSAGAFIPEAVQRDRIKVIVTEIGIGAAGHIDIQDLSSTFGGRIPVNADEKSRPVPRTAQYPVRLTAEPSGDVPELIQRGIVVVSGKAESFLALLERKIITVLLRESGF